MTTYVVKSDSFEAKVSILEDSTILLNGETAEFDIQEIGPSSYSVLVNGHSTKVIIQENQKGYQVLINSNLRELVIKSERELLLESYESKSDTLKYRLEVRAPMPALVVELEVGVGDSIASGQGLLKLEAMKMENEIKSHQSGTVKQILVTKGDTVEKGELLLVLE